MVNRCFRHFYDSYGILIVHSGKTRANIRPGKPEISQFLDLVFRCPNYISQDAYSSKLKNRFKILELAKF